jgi:hypothetical protein
MASPARELDGPLWTKLGPQPRPAGPDLLGSLAQQGIDGHRDPYRVEPWRRRSAGHEGGDKVGLSLRERSSAVCGTSRCHGVIRAIPAASAIASSSALSVAAGG